MDIKIEKVTYNNPKHRKILKVVLSKWFINPKELNWTDPRINYPFNFNKWVELTYKNPKVNSFVLNKNKLIVGMGNIIFNKQTKICLQSNYIKNWGFKKLSQMNFNGCSSKNH